MREITAEELREVLKKHGMWLNDEDGGECADLRYADLSDANLRYADLRYADLSDANLRSADLRYADLSDANLRYADLRYANLRSANLSSANLSYANLSYAKDIFLLPVQDPRGYSWPHAVATEEGWRIRAGCRDFSIDEARAHWGDSYQGRRWIGDMYLHACDWLEKMIEATDEQLAA